MCLQNRGMSHSDTAGLRFQGKSEAGVQTLKCQLGIQAPIQSITASTKLLML